MLSPYSQHNDDDEDDIKPLSKLSVNEVTRLLESLNLANYSAAFEEKLIDGLTLMNCKTEEDVVELGIPLRAKARVLFNEITKRKEFEVQDCICYSSQFYIIAIRYVYP